MYHDLGSAMVASLSTPGGAVARMDTGFDELLDKPVSVLNLSVRASNCLEAARISTLRELVQKSEPELLRFRSFGKTSLHEVQRKLSELGLSLGMKLGEEERGPMGRQIGADESAEDDASSAEEPTEQGSNRPGANPLEVFTMED
jgi:DNA-directed RNA polymerase subunit alpha